MRFLLVVITVSVVCSTPLPDHPQTVFGGFQPLNGARGSGPSSGYRAPSVPSGGYSAPAPAPAYGAPSGGGFGGGGSVGPTKTIYVNVPHPEPVAPPRPIAAGPPRKHYKIVFIRAPPPPPPPQPILPPRTEQKTLIYVLHQRPQVQDQQVIEIPTVKHNPEVFFVQYDNPPTAEELQQLSAGDLSGFSLAAQPLSTNVGLGVVGTSVDDSGEVTFQLGGGGGGGGVPLPNTISGGAGAALSAGGAFIDSDGDVTLPFGSSGGSSFGSGGSTGGVPLPAFGRAAGGGGSSFSSGGAGVPLPSTSGGGISFRSGGAGVPLPSTSGGGSSFRTGGSSGVALPSLGGSGGGGFSGVALPSLGGSGGGGFSGVALPSLGGSGGGGFSGIPGSSIGTGGGAGSNLQLIGDSLVRPIGNTGFFQEVDDDIAELSGFGNIFSAEVDDAFDNRVGAPSPIGVRLVRS